MSMNRLQRLESVLTESIEKFERRIDKLRLARGIISGFADEYWKMTDHQIDFKMDEDVNIKSDLKTYEQILKDIMRFT